MTGIAKVLFAGVAGVTTVAAGATSYLLLSPKAIVLTATKDYQKYCYTLTEFTKDNSDGSKFQLIVCPTYEGRNNASFYLNERSRGINEVSFDKVKSFHKVEGESKVIFTLFNEEKKELYLSPRGYEKELDNLTLQEVCRVNWSDSRNKKLTCWKGSEEIELSLTTKAI